MSIEDPDLGSSTMFDQPDSDPCYSDSGDSEKVCATNNSGVIIDIAQAQLRAYLKLADGQVASLTDICAALEAQKPVKLFTPGRQKEYRRRFEAAYTLMVVMHGSAIGPELIQHLRDRQGAQRKGADDPALLALRSQIDYGGNDDEEERLGRTQLSRDVGALRYLWGRNVSPHAVPALSAEKGEGKNEWYKRYRELRNKPHDQTASERGNEPAITAKVDEHRRFAIALVQLGGPHRKDVVLKQYAALPSGELPEVIEALWHECVDFLATRAPVECSVAAENAASAELSKCQ